MSLYMHIDALRISDAGVFADIIPPVTKYARFRAYMAIVLYYMPMPYIMIDGGEYGITTHFRGMQKNAIQTIIITCIVDLPFKIEYTLEKCFSPT